MNDIERRRAERRQRLIRELAWEFARGFVLGFTILTLGWWLGRRERER